MIKHVTLYARAKHATHDVDFGIYLVCETYGNVSIIKWQIDAEPETKGVVLCCKDDSPMEKANTVRTVVADCLGITPMDITYTVTGLL